jgi:hypothetical protein
MIVNYYEREESILLKLLPFKIIEIFKENCGSLCGGAVTSLFSNSRIKDFDLYFESRESFNKVKKHFDKDLATECNLKLVFSTKNALTYSFDTEGKKGTIQLIKAFHGDINTIFEKFDFYCCMGSYQFSTSKFVLHDSFLKDIAQRRLTFNPATPYPLSSLIRVRKYIGKGYSIDAINLVKLALSIHKLDLNTYAILKEQLQGVDIILFKQLLEKLEHSKEDPYQFEDFVKWLDGLFGNLLDE